MSVPRVNHDLALTIAPHLHRLQKLIVRVNFVRENGLVSLFQPCLNVKNASFRVKYYYSAEDAMNHVAKLAEVAWTKKHLRELIIIWETVQDLLYHSAYEQLAKEISTVLQTMCSQSQQDDNVRIEDEFVQINVSPLIAPRASLSGAVNCKILHMVMSIASCSRKHSSTVKGYR